MAYYLGIDTSNYTTSVAAFSPGRTMRHRRQLLPVRAGEAGLRQSEAVFFHVKQFPALWEDLAGSLRDEPLLGVGVSTRPRDAEGSYMPCFLAGEGFARSLAALRHAPLVCVSHQTGHLLAALYAADALSLRHAPFLAFHVSGGTTEALLVRPDDERILQAACVGRSLDLKAGQAVDRIGVLLGLRFPAGAELAELAEESRTEFPIRPCLRGCDCSLSGVENQAHRLLERGAPPCDVAKFTMESVLAALDGMTGRLLSQYGPLPLVYAGGVMANQRMRAALGRKYGALFASPELSGDNACGVAVAAALRAGWEGA